MKDKGKGNSTTGILQSQKLFKRTLICFACLLGTLWTNIIQKYIKYI